MKKVLSVLMVLIVSLTFASCNSNLIPGAKKSKYIEATRQAIEIIENNATELSECSNLYLNVWHNAIYEEKDKQTNPYTMENGKFVKDFDTALSKLYGDENFKNRLAAIETNQNELRKLRLIIEDAPKGAENFNPSLLGLIDSYVEYSCVILACNGSYNDNLEIINKLDSEFGEYMREFSAYEDEVKAFFA